jgi:2-keto-4-pentenoate hydratase
MLQIRIMSDATPSSPRAQSHWGAPDYDDPRLADGYFLQRRDRTARLQAGVKLIGAKVGVNDPASQQRLRLSGPLIGYLTDASIIDGEGSISIGAYTLAGVEPELAIWLRHDVGPGADVESVRAAIEHIGLCAEIIDVSGRYDDVAALIGGNIMHRGVVFSAGHIPFSENSMNSSWLEARLNGAPVWQLPLGFILGDPRDALRFVADALARQDGELLSGHVIMTGLLTPIPIWVKAGDRVQLDAGPFGSLDLNFSR